MKRKKDIQNDELPRGALRAVVLSLLAEKPAHGYALARSVGERTAGALKMREGTLYPALYELEVEGLIEAEVEVGGIAGLAALKRPVWPSNGAAAANGTAPAVKEGREI